MTRSLRISTNQTQPLGELHGRQDHRKRPVKRYHRQNGSENDTLREQHGTRGTAVASTWPRRRGNRPTTPAAIRANNTPRGHTLRTRPPGVSCRNTFAGGGRKDTYNQPRPRLGCFGFGTAATVHPDCVRASSRTISHSLDARMFLSQPYRVRLLNTFLHRPL
jgi:hypothetical protein